MDERFDKATSELELNVGQIHTRMENDKHISYESIMSILNKIAIQRE